MLGYAMTWLVDYSDAEGQLHGPVEALYVPGEQAEHAVAPADRHSLAVTQHVLAYQFQRCICVSPLKLFFSVPVADCHPSDRHTYSLISAILLQFK